VFTLRPFNFFTPNIGTALTNAWAVGKGLHPVRFGDLDPAAMAQTDDFELAGPAPSHPKPSRLHGSRAATLGWSAPVTWNTRRPTTSRSWAECCA
jgi:hypothetical protein